MSYFSPAKPIEDEMDSDDAIQEILKGE